MLSFLQINLHKATQATILAGRELENKQQIVACITEPHTTAGRITGMPTNTNIVYHRPSKGQPAPRAGLVASKDLKLTSMDNWCNRDCAVAVTSLHGRRTILASIYLDITQPAVPPWLEQLLDMAENKRMPMIIAMDSNAHSALYGPDNNKRGDDLEDFILARGLEIQNVGNAPTYETHRGTKLVQTHIDVTLTKDLHFQIENWRVDRSYNASDHNTIRFEAIASPNQTTKLRPWSKADWTTFTSSLTEADYKIPKDMSMKKLDKLVDRLYSCLDQALDLACPEITTSQVVHSSHWATEKHEQHKNKVSALYKQAKTSGDKNDWQTYKIADKKFKQMCVRDRNKAWRKYKETLQSEKDMASLAKLAQREERRNINTLTRADGTCTDPGKDTITLFTDTHFPSASDKRHVTYNNRRNCSIMELEDKYNEWINPQLIKKALAGFEKKKSPGPDGIKPLVFDYLPREFLDTLLIAYKACLLYTSPSPRDRQKSRMPSSA